jgi:hypothetical protein
MSSSRGADRSLPLRIRPDFLEQMAAGRVPRTLAAAPLELRIIGVPPGHYVDDNGVARPMRPLLDEIAKRLR